MCFYFAEAAVKPPPDLNYLLRQEREVERNLLESQFSKTPTQKVRTHAVYETELIGAGSLSGNKGGGLKKKKMKG